MPCGTEMGFVVLFTVVNNEQKKKSEENGGEEARKDLKSRGLCLVPVEWTVHVASSNGADFWSHASGSASESICPWSHNFWERGSKRVKMWVERTVKTEEFLTFNCEFWCRWIGEKWEEKGGIFLLDVFGKKNTCGFWFEGGKFVAF